jgi:hypothetical protein
VLTSWLWDVEEGGRDERQGDLETPLRSSSMLMDFVPIFEVFEERSRSTTVNTQSMGVLAVG